MASLDFVKTSTSKQGSTSEGVSAWGGNRTRMGNAHNILSVACIPIPPPKHVIFYFFYFGHDVLVLNCDNWDKELVNFSDGYLDDLR